MNEQETQQLILTAVKAAVNAYAPYSHYHVGAAIMTEDGRIFPGCNVENASFGLTNCAERTAIFSAVAEGYREFKGVAIAAASAIPYPCGACRQVMNEFCKADTPVLIIDCNNTDDYQKITLGELLPHTFTLKDE